MTPTGAERIYYRKYREGLRWKEVEKPIVQRELRRDCWQAVIEAIERPLLKENHKLRRENAALTKQLRAMAAKLIAHIECDAATLNRTARK